MTETTFDLIKKKLEKASKGNRMMILSESDIACKTEYIPTEAYEQNPFWFSLSGCCQSNPHSTCWTGSVRQVIFHVFEPCGGTEDGLYTCHH